MEQLGLSIGNVLSLVGILLVNIGVVYRAWSSYSVKIAQLESQYCSLKERIDRDTNRTETAIKELKNDIVKLYDKIDELKDLIIELKQK